jgi:transcriptional regulator with XRE-family HTH domain
MNWSQEEAAEFCGIGQKMFQLYELGIKDNPSLKQLEKIAQGFGLDVSELIATGPKGQSKRSKSVRKRK